MNGIALCGLSYELGDQVRAYKDAENFAAVMARHRIPDLPALMGFGCYRRTSDDILTLAIKSARKTLASTGLSGEDIDVVFFCSTNFGVIGGDGREYVYQLCKQLGLSRAYPVGITLNNCTTFLSALKIAQSMLPGSHYKNILVVTSDKVYDETQRCIQYGIFSDSAASCVVSKELSQGFELLASDFRSDYRLIESGAGLNDDAIYASVQQNLLAAANYRVSDITKTFTNNIFVPIVRAKETRLGFSDRQLYLDNVAEKAHCFAADALINLTDYAANRQDEDGSLYVLSADAEGLRVSLLLGQLQPRARELRAYRQRRMN